MKVLNYSKNFGEINIEFEVHFERPRGSYTDMSGFFFISNLNQDASKCFKEHSNLFKNSKEKISDSNEFNQKINSIVDNYINLMKYDNLDESKLIYIAFEKGLSNYSHSKQNIASVALNFMIVNEFKNGNLIIKATDKDNNELKHNGKNVTEFQDFGSSLNTIKIPYSKEKELFLTQLSDKIQEASKKLDVFFSIKDLEEINNANQILDKRMSDLISSNQKLLE